LIIVVCESVPTSVSGHNTPSFLEDTARQELQIHLMANAEAWWDDPQVVERLCPPFQKLITFSITTELDLHIEAECVRAPEIVDLHRMVDNKIDGNHGLYNRHVTAAPSDGRAHRSEVDKKRNARKILEQHATDHKGYLRCPVCLWLPICQSFDVLRPDALAIEVAEYRFEENADAYR
jgi:hypothetical protein